MRRVWTVCLGLLAACSRTPDDAPDTDVGDTDAAQDTDVAIPWGTGPRVVSGNAYFFDMPTLGQVVAEENVEGGEVYLLEAPEIRAWVDPADGYAFRLEGIPDGVGVTIALVQEDHYPHLTATIPVDGADIEGVTFQSVTWTIADALAGVVGADARDPRFCQMVVTVTAPQPDGVYALGEPDTTVTVSPAVTSDHGPVYFNTSVIPDRRLTATTTDGGVIVAGVEPGVYEWTGHKEGVALTPLRMTCVAGWLTNASPPWGMNATHLTSAPPAP